MQLNEILTLKFPNADFTRDIRLVNRGKGIEIEEWNLSDPKPTQADIDQWGIELAAQYQSQQNRVTNKPIYDQLDLIDLKSIRAIRENDTQRILDLESQAAILRGQLL